MTRAFARAVAHHQSGRFRQAERACTQILESSPQHAGAWHLLGLLAAESGRPSLAAGLIGQAIQLAGPVAHWCVHLGMILEHERNYPGAAACYRQALENAPSDAATAFRLGNLLVQCGQFDEAIERYKQTTEIRPDFSEAWFNLGVANSMANHLTEAVAGYRRAIEISPAHAEAHNNLGILFQASGRLEEAAEEYACALESKPEYVEARYNLGLLRQQQDRLEDSAEAYRRVLELQPRHVEAQNNLGNTLLAANQPIAAREAYRHALAIDSAHPEALWNLGFVELLLGNFVDGWKNYEWRFKQSQSARMHSTRPQWRGEPLKGRSLLLWAEQGLGDTIQMIRFASLVKAAGARVILECPRTLSELFRTAAGVDEIVIRGEEPPGSDFQIPLMSLPGLFQIDLGSLPGNIPYLAACPARTERWRTHLASYARPRIGLVWAGNPKHANDRNRSCSPALLRPLIESGASIFTMQPDAKAPDGVVSLAGLLTDFAETAAAVSAMDLVISVDTSVAHLAGALGRPVWTLLPHAPDWRWLMDRDDSPWYPTMRLFRQQQRGDWAGVIERVVEALELRPPVNP